MNTEKKIEGICLTSIDYKENDKIVYLMTQEGKISAMLKGVKKPNAKLKMFCQPFCFAEYMLVYKGQMPVISNATLNKANFELLQDYEKFEIASKGLKIVYDLSYQIQDNPALYSALCIFLNSLSKIENNYIHYLNIFLLKILEISGYGINLEYCSLCGDKLDEKSFFDVYQGQYYCSKCAGRQSEFIEDNILNYFKSLNSQFSQNVIMNANIILKRVMKLHFDYDI